jgi:hypothetical protein
VVLKLKKIQIFFETYTLRVVVPIYPYEGYRYNDPMDEDTRSSVIEKNFKITGHKEDHINTMVDGELSWRSVKSYEMDYEDAMERWKNKLYELSTRRCTHISTEEREE